MAANFEHGNLLGLLEPLCEPYRIQVIVVFGSTVTGLRGPESDLDLAFLADTPLDPVAVTTDVIRVLHTDRVDVVDL